MSEILIVEDDKALSEGIALSLRAENITFVQAYTLEEGRRGYREGSVDLVLLDVNLPDGSGLSLLEEIQKKGETPVILLTANDLETDIVSGLLAGAQDYITKPFSLAVLRARVQVQLRRKKEDRRGLSFGTFFFDFERQEYRKGKENLELSRTEQRLLRILVENAGRCVAREQILIYVWPEEWEFVEENALSVAITRLRGKLSQKGCIRTVYGIGYCWEVDRS